MVTRKPAAGRIGKDVARHLKARTCLHEATYYRYHTELGWQDKAERLLKLAADETDAIINSGRYEIYNTGKPEKIIMKCSSWKIRLILRKQSFR